MFKNEDSPDQSLHVFLIHLEMQLNMIVHLFGIALSLPGSQFSNVTK